MRDRLVELIQNAHDEQKYLTSDKSIQAIADYLRANGVIVLPCKIAERIYQTDGVRIYESSIHEITYTASKTIYVTENIVFDETAIGTSIFLTREEAEAKLKEGAE